jgi:hypothetical protein
LQYNEIQESPEIQKAREEFANASESEKGRKLVNLNRLILEVAYPLKCPKTAATGSEAGA